MDMSEVLAARAAQKQYHVVGATERLNTRRYIVRLITDTGLSACVSYHTEDAVHPSKKRAHRFDILKQAVVVRDYYAKSPSINSAWIIFE